jgi:coenzyme F420-reducing hydrogenase beta subunit
MKPDKEGFLYPHVDLNLCSDCKKCEKACPMQYDMLQGDLPVAFAAWNADESVRLASSSGGVFHALMSHTLLSGGVVFGAAFDNQMRLRHQYAETMEDALKFRGSKYVQSIIGNSYKLAQEFLNDNRKVLFSGTPCQIAGLYSFIHGNNANLLTCDVVCHGVPSPKVFSYYKSYLEKREKGIIKKIVFRDKHKGWKQYSVSYFFDTKKELKKPFWNDSFMIGFLKDIFLRPSCYACPFSRFPRVADISLADFWGVNEHHPEWDDDKGTSLVMVQSEKGKVSFDSCRSVLIVRDADLDVAIRSNPCICSSVAPSMNRVAFFSDLENLSFEQVLRKYMRIPSFWEKIIGKFNQILKYAFSVISRKKK